MSVSAAAGVVAMLAVVVIPLRAGFLLSCQLLQSLSLSASLYAATARVSTIIVSSTIGRTSGASSVHPMVSPSRVVIHFILSPVALTAHGRSASPVSMTRMIDPSGQRGQ